MVFRLDNSVRRYAWGSRQAIQAFLGQPPETEPLAELWIGAHPDLPSRIFASDVDCDLGQISLADRAARLDDMIAAAPEAMLGADCCQRLGPQLPFLAKLLAAAQPLSLQVHPDPNQAAAGFAAENAAGISLADPERCFRDPRDKPEIIYALSHFQVMSGLRQPNSAAQLISALEVPVLTELTDILKTVVSASGLDKYDQFAAINRAAFEWLFAARQEASNWTGQVAQAAQALLAGGADPAYAVVLELVRRYPNDPTGLVPLLLNYFVLEPGQVLFTPAGCLHAYVRGLGLEVMGASDNVLRAGITPKLIDTTKVLQIARFGPTEPIILTSQSPQTSQKCQVFTPDQGDFALTVADLGAGDCLASPTGGDGDPGPRLALSLEGEVHVLGGPAPLALPAFAAAFIPASAGQVELVGQGRVALVGLIA